ncbi:MAG: ArnT family glycosyltransferase [Adhaeribacter sp.]
METKSHHLPAPFLLGYFALYLALKVSFASGGQDLFSEEAQYWLWSKHPDWSYYSKPPLIAWVNGAASWLFGDRTATIRFTALALGLATLYGYYRLALLLFASPRLAAIAVVLLSVTPYFLLASTFLTTDSLLLFFWVWSTCFLVLAVQQNKWRYWVLTGLCFGLGCLSKYAMLFFLLLLLSPYFRQQGRQLWPRVALVLALALALNLPVLWWNQQHDWLSLRHTGQVAGAYPRLLSWDRSLANIGKFLGGLVLMNSPFLFPFLLPAARWYKNNSFPGADKLKLSLTLAPALGTAGVFLLLSIRKGIEVNWYAMGLLLLPLAMAYVIEKKKLFRLALAGTALSLLATALFLFPTLPQQAGLPGLPLQADPMKRLAGWQQLAGQVQDLRQGPYRHQASVLLTDSYHIASELAFYTGDKNVVCLQNGSRRMNQFDLWPDPLVRLQGQEFLGFYVSDNYPPLNQFFSGQILAEKQIPIRYRGREVRKFYVLVVQDFKRIAVPTSSSGQVF